MTTNPLHPHSACLQPQFKLPKKMYKIIQISLTLKQHLTEIKIYCKRFNKSKGYAIRIYYLDLKGQYLIILFIAIIFWNPVGFLIVYNVHIVRNTEIPHTPFNLIMYCSCILPIQLLKSMILHLSDRCICLGSFNNCIKNSLTYLTK